MAQPAGDQLRAQFATVHGKLHEVGQIWFLMVLMLSADARTNTLPARWVEGGVPKFHLVLHALTSTSFFCCPLSVSICFFLLVILCYVVSLLHALRSQVLQMLRRNILHGPAH